MNDFKQKHMEEPTIIETKKYNIFSDSPDETIAEFQQRQRANETSDNYFNPYDILTESIQNSVDAIIKNPNIKNGEIKLILDCDKKIYTIIDNGHGIPSDKIDSIFRSNFSLKSFEEETGVVGCKGVGLNYLINLTDEFLFETLRNNLLISGELSNTRTALSNSKIPLPELITHKSKSDINGSYTKFVFSKLHERVGNIFNYSFPEIEIILRTRTSIGNTKTFFGSNPEKPIKIHIEIIKEDKKEIMELENTPIIPHKYLENALNYKEWQKLKNKGNTLEKAKGVPVWISDKIEYNGKKYEFYAIAGKGIFEKIRTNFYKGEKSEIIKELLSNGAFLSKQNYIPCEVLSATKHVEKGQMYWYYMYVLIKDDQAKIDLGRKILLDPDSTLKKVATKIFSDYFRDHIDFIIADSGDKDIESMLLKEQKVKEQQDKIMQSPDLNISFDDTPRPKLRYQKIPTCEQDVVAIFNQLLSLGYFYDAYEIYGSSGKNTYDSLVSLENYKGMPKWMEFKFAAENILNDFKSIKKQSFDVTLLVCWDIDVSKFTGSKFKIRNKEDKNWPGVSFEIVHPTQGRPIQIIALRQFLEKIKK